MRILSTILLICACLSAFSQQQTLNVDYLQANRRFNLANYIVRGISNDSAFIGPGSPDSLVTQFALKNYLFNHYGPGTNNIYGLEHQLITIKTDGSNQHEAIEPVVDGVFVTTDQELADAKLVFVDQATIFSQWKRFSHGDSLKGKGNPDPSNVIPGTPSETNSWSYNAGTQTINSTYNSSSVIGFVSPQKYSNYTHRVTLTGHVGGDGFDDNDYINVIAAYMEDGNDLVPNHAYGRNPADFSWPINTTSQFIPNQHTITLVRGRTNQDSFPFIGQTIRYALVYDFGKASEQVLVNGESSPGLWNTTLPYGSGRNCDVEIIRQGDIIKAYTTNWDDAPGGKGILQFELTYDLASLPITQKFRGASAYGYGALSQENATFTDITAPNVNVIYDVRNGDKWVADFNGNYTLDTTTLYDDYGVRRWFHNSTTDKTIYYRADRTFFVVGGSTVIDTTTTSSDYVFNEEDFLVINRNVSIIPKEMHDLDWHSSVAFGITDADTARWNRIKINDSTFLDDRDFSDTGTITDPIRTKPLIITSVGTTPSYNHNTKVLNIPTGSATPNLQQVTDVGEKTTQPIRANQFEVADPSDISAAGVGSLLSVDYGGTYGASLRMKGSNNFFITIRPNGALGANRAIFWPDKAGTVALLSDIPASGSSTVGTITWLGTTYNINSGNNVTLTTPTTSNISEGSNLYYTDARARAAISVTGSGGSYDNTTGIITLTGGGSSSGWALTGNATAGTEKLGTTNDHALRFYTNGFERGYFDSGTVSTTTNGGGKLVLNSGMRVMGTPSSFGTTGAGLEFSYNSTGTTSTIGSYNRATSTALPLTFFTGAVSMSSALSSSSSIAGTVIKATAASPFPAGPGVELYYGSSEGNVTVYNRTSNAYLPLNINALVIKMTADGVVFPKKTTAQRNALTGVVEGQTIYNTDTHQNETWNATTWAH